MWSIKSCIFLLFKFEIHFGRNFHEKLKFKECLMNKSFHCSVDWIRKSIFNEENFRLTTGELNWMIGICPWNILQDLPDNIFNQFITVDWLVIRGAFQNYAVLVILRRYSVLSWKNPSNFVAMGVLGSKI